MSYFLEGRNTPLEAYVQHTSMCGVVVKSFSFEAADPGSNPGTFKFPFFFFFLFELLFFYIFCL